MGRPLFRVQSASNPSGCCWSVFVPPQPHTLRLTYSHVPRSSAAASRPTCPQRGQPTPKTPDRELGRGRIGEQPGYCFAFWAPLLLFASASDEGREGRRGSAFFRPTQPSASAPNTTTAASRPTCPVRGQPTLDFRVWGLGCGVPGFPYGGCGACWVGSVSAGACWLWRAPVLICWESGFPCPFRWFSARGPERDTGGVVALTCRGRSPTPRAGCGLRPHYVPLVDHSSTRCKYGNWWIQMVDKTRARYPPVHYARGPPGTGSMGCVGDVMGATEELQRWQAPYRQVPEELPPRHSLLAGV